jgi:hypothetical protein
LYNNYKLDLGVSFTKEAYTQDMIPIYNFGYGLDIRPWNSEYEYYEYDSLSDAESGEQSKRYFDCKDSRAIVRKFVNKYVKYILSKFEFPIIVRGPLTTFKQNSQRYLDIDNIIKSFGYHRVVIKMNDLIETDSYIPFEDKSENKDKDEYWFYSKEKLKKHDVCYLLEH